MRPLYLLITLLIGLSLVTYQMMKAKDVQIANNIIAAQKQGLFTYEILTTIKSKSIHSDTNLTMKEINELPNKIAGLKGITPLQHDELKFNGVVKGKNIIVIQAEAFQNFAVNLEIDGQEVTPFLNDLLSESIYFPNAMQQVGPGNTSDAEFIFNTSLYPAELEPSSELYEEKAFPSLPKLLKEEGYKSITFHPNDINFWNRNHLYPALGFDDYYDDTFFKDEDIIGMGSSDELVYKKAFPELKALYDADQPFYAQFVTLTSHHPFKIPADKDTLELPNKFDRTILKNYLKSLTYTDWALEQFVDDLKEANMWEDSILVFYGDHMGMQAKKRTEKELKLLSEFVGHEYKRIDQFNIPFIITLPGENISEQYETVNGQLDFMPTVANLLDLSLANHIHFGQDIINYPDNLFGMRYYMPEGSFYYDDIAFIPAEGFDDGEAFNWKTGETISDFSSYKQYYDRMIQILKLSDDYINNLPNR